MEEPDKYDFLANEAPEAEQPAIEAAPVAESPPETVAAAPVAPTAPEPHEEHVPMAALKAERAKRQQRDREVEERDRIIEQMRQAQQQPPNFYEAPEEYIQTYLRQHEQQTTARMLSALEEQAREVHTDYDDVIDQFKEQAQESPALFQKVMQSPNPPMAAYRLGKQLRAVQQMQDPDAYRKQIEAEVRAKVDAEYRAKEDARTRAASAIPPDLTAARASRGDEPLPDDSLEAILASRNKR